MLLDRETDMANIRQRNRSHEIPERGSHLLAVYEKKGLRFYLRECRTTRGDGKFRSIFWISMVGMRDDVVIKISLKIPVGFAHSLVGLSTFKGIDVCETFFASQRFKFERGPVSYGSPLGSTRLTKGENNPKWPMIEMTEDSDSASFPDGKGLEQQSREPPMK